MSYIQKYFFPSVSIPALINGILLYHNLPLSIFSTITTIAHIGYPVFTQDTQCRKQKLLLFCTWSCIGWVASYCEINTFNTFHATITNRICDIEGTVTDYQYCAHLRNKHRITVTLSHYVKEEKKHSLSGTIYVYVNSPSVEQLYYIGTNLFFKKIQVRKPEQQFAHYLIKENILGTAFINSHTIVLKESTCKWYTYTHMARDFLFTRIQSQLSTDQFALFSALFLGNKIYNKTDTEPIQDSFRIWGISHIFARSGMHISIIISILLSLLWIIPITHSIKIICITTIGVMYTMCSWSSISFIRAFIMFILNNYGMIHKRYTNPLYLLTLTTIFVLISHPLNLFFLDFQLSFALTASLIWICTNISRAT